VSAPSTAASPHEQGPRHIGEIAAELIAQLKPSDRPHYIITLRAEPAAAAPIIRLRKLLRFAGRVLALKCVDVREVRS
jgi:hypothetical protein